MISKHPNRYGLMAMVSIDDYEKFKKYRLLLENHVDFFMEHDFVNGISPQHLSLCYFSYENKYSESQIKNMIPRIKKIIKGYSPITLKVKGLSGWWEIGSDWPVIMWNITNFGNVEKIHNEIMGALSSEIEHFRDPELFFSPHIGVAFVKSEKIEEIKKIISESKKDEEQEIHLDRIFIYFPSGPKEIFKLT